MDKNNLCAADKPLANAVSMMYESVTAGRSEAAERLAGRIFSLLSEGGGIEKLRDVYIDIYVQIVVRSIKRISPPRLKKIAYIATSTDLGEVERLMLEEIRSITEENAPEFSGGYNALIRETVRIIDDNIGNEQLSLRWIAGNILYTNVDYLGKLFKKETGMNFSHYVMEKRMKLAMKILGSGGTDKIYEVAEMTGYGTNSQYFSQVFKKYAGCSPIEFRESALRNNS